MNDVLEWYWRSKNLFQDHGIDFVYEEAKLKESDNFMDRWILSFTQSLLLFLKQEMDGTIWRFQFIIIIIIKTNIVIALPNTSKLRFMHILFDTITRISGWEGEMSYDLNDFQKS